MMIGRRDRHADPDTHDHDGDADRHDADRHDADRYDDSRTHARHADHDHTRVDDAAARDKYGGVNVGAAFFGWLVAIALTVLLSSIVAAIASAIGANANVTQSQAQREAGTVGLAAAIVLLVVLLIAYYAGGYVAGRMSRFDGARQGVAVWLIGLLVTLLAVGLGVVFGDQYNVMDRVDMPRIPIPTDTATWGGIITGIAVLVGTLLAAVLGGKVGHRYHDKVDRTAWR